MRPADGLLTDLTITRSEEGFYDATLRKASYATLQALDIDEITELAFGLTYER